MVKKVLTKILTVRVTEKEYNYLKAKAKKEKKYLSASVRETLWKVIKLTKRGVGKITIAVNFPSRNPLFFQLPITETKEHFNQCIQLVIDERNT